MLDSCGKIVKLVIIQYLFDEGVEVPVILPPHGNQCKEAGYSISSYSEDNS